MVLLSRLVEYLRSSSSPSPMLKWLSCCAPPAMDNKYMRTTDDPDQAHREAKHNHYIPKSTVVMGCNKQHIYIYITFPDDSSIDPSRQ